MISVPMLNVEGPLRFCAVIVDIAHRRAVQEALDALRLNGPFNLDGELLPASFAFNIRTSGTYFVQVYGYQGDFARALAEVR